MHRTFYYTFVLALLLNGCALLPVSAGRKAFSEGEALFKKGDYEQASVKFTAAMQKDASLQREGYVYLAECSLKKKDYTTALLQAQQAMDACAADAGIRARLKVVVTAGGQSAMGNHDYDAAIRFFKDAAALDPRDSSARLWLGKALLERGGRGDMRAAIVEFKTVMNLSASPAQDLAFVQNALFARAEEYARQGDMYTESRCYLAYTENFNQKDVEACIRLGRLFSRMGNPVGALYYAKKAYALDPKNKAAIELMNNLNTPIHP